MDAAAIDGVRFWIKPARRFEPVRPDEQGWPAHAMIHAVGSIAELEAYLWSEAPARNARERSERGWDGLLRTERRSGRTAFAAPG